jgi:hypothetical protein
VEVLFSVIVFRLFFLAGMLFYVGDASVKILFKAIKQASLKVNVAGKSEVPDK